MPAAKSAYCAGQQDPKLFWDLHDWLFANQSTWSDDQNASEQFRQQAVALGAEAARYDDCLKAPATEARIQQDQQEGIKLQIEGTPSIFVNDWYKFGASLQEIEQMISQARQGIHPPPTPTPLPEGAEFFDPNPQQPGFTYDGSPTLGATDAKVVMIAFEDFKSADAAQHATTVEPALKSKYIDTNQMRLVFKSFPDTAPQAAVAALCAAKQGKFWEFRSLLYQSQAEWQEGDAAALTGYAKGLGMESSTFEKCLQDEQMQAEVNTALTFGQEQIGVPATPSFLLIKLAASGEMEDVKGLPGLQTLDLLESTIDALLKPTPTPPAAISADKLASLPMGKDDDGNFYRGDPAAPIRLVDFSDYQ